MIVTLLCYLALSQQNDPQAIKAISEIPDAFAKLDSFDMKVKLTAVVGSQAGIVSTAVTAMKPNMFIIDQTSQTANGAEHRRFVCDGKIIAFPEPRHPERFIGDPHPLPQWAGNMRSIGALMLDNGWPLGMVFRAKEETQEFLNTLRNVKMADGPEDGPKVVTGEVWERDPRFVGQLNGSPIPIVKAFDIEVVIGQDGLLSKLTLRSNQLIQTEDIAKPDPRYSRGEPIHQPGKHQVDLPSDPNQALSTMVWEVTVTKGTKATKEQFKLPPLHKAQIG